MGETVRAAARLCPTSVSTSPSASARPTKTMRDPSSSPQVGCSPRTSHAVKIPTTGTSSVKGATVEAGGRGTSQDQTTEAEKGETMPREGGAADPGATLEE